MKDKDIIKGTKPMNCSCGGKPVGRGRSVSCGICNRVVQKKTRNEAIERWNESIRDLYDTE